MSNQGKSRKSLIVGIIAAVVVLTTVLCLTMVGCNNEQTGTGTTAAPTTIVGDAGAETYDLYWNVDRAEYDGKSEAGMSSREPAEDGYFHVRFFKDGEFVELRVADRKTVNALEVQDLMGLEFDKDGIVVGIIAIDDMPCEQIAWQFYVQSVGGKLIKTNSSASMNGMEILVETNENTGIYDMSGVTGEKGIAADLMQGDRVLIVGNEDGEVTHVFVYDRPNYMNSHEGYCKHCEKDVTWLEWNKETILPTTTGHYQLTADMTGVTQSSMVEDAKICLDLNGHRVDGGSGKRILSLHNAGTELAIMDTSEAQTGRIAAHGKGDQGMVVWVRYGVFYLYEGILDGSDATTTKNGPTVNMGANTFMYMYGGEIIGGTSIPVNSAGTWSGGLAGTMQVNSGAKFVMYDGLIHKGRAIAAVTKYDTNGQPSTYFNGIGGNIVINGGIMEMRGGTVRDGYACQSGNIHMMGKGEFYLYDGLISNGQAYGKGKNGGNLYAGANNIIEMRGGTIRNGKTMNCGGNVYFNGTFKMTDGIITDGKCYNWTTKEVNEAAASRNLFGVQGDLYMYGGRIAGGVQMIDSDGTKNDTTILVSARSVIFDEDGTGPHLTLSDTSGGSQVVMYVGQMHDEGKIGISKVQAAVFTKPTNKNNADNFISDIEGADIGWIEEGLVIGKVHCMCSSEPDATTHKPGCDGVQYAWAPWNSTTLPAGNANYYLTKDITLTGGTTIGDNVNIRLDLNGHTASLNNKYRIYSFLNAENSSLTITDTSAEQTGAIKKIWTSTTDYASNQGGIIWGGIKDASYDSENNTINLIAGTLDSSEYIVQQGGTVVAVDGRGTVFNMYGGTVKGGQVVPKGTTNYHGGSILVSAGNTFNLYGGTIQGGRANGGCQGGNIAVRGTMNMYGGTIKDGDWDASSSDANIRVFNNGTYGALYMYGGTIAGGVDYNSHGGPAIMQVSGASVIDKSLTSSGCAVPTISLRGGTTYGGSFYPLQVGEMKSGASIYVTPVQAVFTDVTEEEYTQYFHADNGTSNIYWIDNAADYGLTEEDNSKLFCGNVQKHCICGSTTEEHAQGCDKVQYVWHELSDLNGLTVPGNYYLTKSLTTDGQFGFKAGTTRLDFNGYTISDTGYRLFTTNGATNAKVWFTDTSADKNGGLVLNTSGAAYNGQGVGFWIAGSGCELNWLAGTMDASKVKCYQYGGAAVYIAGNTTFNLYGGTIKGGLVYKDTNTGSGKEPYGGTIRVCANGTFNMYGGTVTDGRSEGYHGGNINIMGTMNMWGGVVENGTTGEMTNGTDGHGGNIALNADGAVLNLYGGEIRNGASIGWAGNVYMYPGAGKTCALNMSGGLITGGKGSTTNANHASANIALRNGAVLNLSGGEITGRISAHNNETATVKLSGSIKISESATSNRLWINPLDDKGTPDIKLVIAGPINSDAVIKLTSNTKAFNGTNVRPAGQIATAAEGYTITAEDMAKLDFWYVNGSNPGTNKTKVLHDNAIWLE